MRITPRLWPALMKSRRDLAELKRCPPAVRALPGLGRGSAEIVERIQFDLGQLKYKYPRWGSPPARQSREAWPPFRRRPR